MNRWLNENRESDGGVGDEGVKMERRSLPVK